MRSIKTAVEREDVDVADVRRIIRTPHGGNDDDDPPVG